MRPIELVLYGATQGGRRALTRVRDQQGGAQGDVLSPLLWNIFFEPLVRRLAGLPGVSVERGPKCRLPAGAADTLFELGQ